MRTNLHRESMRRSQKKGPKAYIFRHLLHNFTQLDGIWQASSYNINHFQSLSCFVSLPLSCLFQFVLSVFRRRIRHLYPNVKRHNSSRKKRIHSLEMVYGCCEGCIKKWQTVHLLKWFAYRSVPRMMATWEYPNVQLGHIDTNVWFLFSGLFISSTFSLFFTHWFPYMLIRRIECSPRLVVSGSEYWSCWYFIFVGCQQICTLNEFIGMPEKKNREIPIRMEFIRKIGSEQKDWNKKIGPIVKSLRTQSNGQVQNICSCQQTVVSSAPPFFSHQNYFPFFNSLSVYVWAGAGEDAGVWMWCGIDQNIARKESTKMLKT